MTDSPDPAPDPDDGPMTVTPAVWRGVSRAAPGDPASDLVILLALPRAGDEAGDTDPRPADVRARLAARGDPADTAGFSLTLADAGRLAAAIDNFIVTLADERRRKS